MDLLLATKEKLLEELEKLKADNIHLNTLLLNSNEPDSGNYELLASIQQFKAIADYFPVIMWTTAPDGSADYFNKPFYNYTGLTIQESMGWGWKQAVHPDDLQLAIDSWKLSVERGIPYEAEYRFKKNNDDTWRWQLAQGIPLKDNNGNVLKWFGTNTDIHDQKEAEKRKDEFLSIASHELKTPLTSLKAFLQLSSKLIPPADRSCVFIEKALKQSARLETLINNLLDVAKINAGKLIYNKETFNFDTLLTEAVESFQLTAQTHRITLERGANVEYTGDRLRIEQVIFNFLSNAEKYSPGKDEIIIRSQIQENNIVVSIQDLGIGIAPENLNSLFDRYYRVDNRSEQFQGLGLGLYIASEIIKRHNGSFWIESAVGEGSTFYFLLPIKGKQELIDIATDDKIYYKGNYIEINYNPEKQWLEANWLGYQDYDSVKKGCMIILDLMAKNNCTKVLNDNTHVIGNWSEAVDWGAEFWFPAMENAGLKHFAWIYSTSTFSRMSARKSIDITMGKITAQFFTDKQEAINWLESVQ